MTRPDDAAPAVGTLHYAEGGAATAPQNLGGLTRRRRELTDKLVKGWRVLLGPGEGADQVREIAAGETLTPVGTVTPSGDSLGVLKFQPVLYTHANLQEYRARRRREEQVGRFVLGVLALALTVSVSVVLFVHPTAKKTTTLTGAEPVPAPIAAPVAPAAPARVEAPRQHTIAKGDTLGAIAGRYGVKLKALLAANDLTEKATLRIGRKLLIPGTTTVVAAPPAAPVAAAPPREA
ncbi:MAG: LysM peptidoglycan-binding domain-containing protein, partial [Candidatus Sericytochromatia bacterium]|nr:LysM peptidoglycan-binding domain-containing protein [Candidatus Tanganyikabacteria bacterium]